MNKQRYIKTIIRKLKCSNKKKKEIKRELEADIQIALEIGEEWQDIEERMGSPYAQAAEFNENLPETEWKTFKRIKKIKLLFTIVIMIGLLAAGIYSFIPKTYEIDNNSIFNKDKVISQAEMIIGLIDKKEYDTVKNQYADAKMAKLMKETSITDAKERLGGEFGEFQSFTSVYTVEVKQMGRHFAVVQITALYEKQSVLYTISFNEDMKLAGLYMK